MLPLKSFLLVIHCDLTFSSAPPDDEMINISFNSSSLDVVRAAASWQTAAVGSVDNYLVAVETDPNYSHSLWKRRFWVRIWFRPDSSDDENWDWFDLDYDYQQNKHAASQRIQIRNKKQNSLSVIECNVITIRMYKNVITSGWWNSAGSPRPLPVHCVHCRFIASTAGFLYLFVFFFKFPRRIQIKSTFAKS